MAGAFPQREFGALRSQARLVNIAEAKRTDYWAGTTYVLQTAVRNGAGAGTVEMVVTPGEDSEFEILGCTIIGADAVSRFARSRIKTDASIIADFLIVQDNLANGNIRGWPQANTGIDAGSASGKKIVSGTMNVDFQLLSASASSGADFTLVARVRGEKPTFTMDFSAGGSGTINVNSFF